jgi:beta-fructofuranosidase
MSLFLIIKACGGIHNVLRILAPDSRIIIEIKDISLVSTQAIQQNYNRELNQLTYYKASIKDQKQLASQLFEVGQCISEEQRKSIVSCTYPVECEYRPRWHISPPQGLLNDPNGFIYHQGKYHLFYQWYPYACEHKDKYWVHLTSQDLIDWDWQSVALTPSDWFDSHGVFSGHALSHNDQLMVFYTGNVRIGEQRDRQTMQCLASSTDGINFTKQGPVISELPPGVTPHCRDPKVFRHGDHWLMLLGAQREDEVGRLAVYRSDDLKSWCFVGLCGDELGDFGYMWECPDFFTLNHQDFIVLCPQGIKSSSKYHTVPHYNGIVKAQLDAQDKVTLFEFQYLDFGFDFYAPQSLLTPDGRRVITAWMGLPDEVNQPSIESGNGWVHQLTTYREISFEQGKLLQKPLKELQTLRRQKIVVPENSDIFELYSKSFELNLIMQWGSSIRLHLSNKGYCEIRLEEQTKTLFLDRTQTLIREGDSIRELTLPESTSVRLQVLSDTSSLEIFINDGEAVMSARVFTDKEATQLSCSGEINILDSWLF